MPITLGTRDLLEYNAKHSVLICRECKYAIQKNALGSHLLRHKIYRGKRQELLSSIAGLELLEPDDVQLPTAGSPPVDGLPIISGYRCTATRCESLCASSKRMRRHWSEIHGVSDPPDSFARSVNIQTFFRGTKLRYFEVASSKATAERLPVTSDGRTLQQRGLGIVITPTARVQMSILPPGPLCDLDLDLDLETLRYFHHFTTTTSLMLPAEKQWQDNMVAQALWLRWLMCGLLAISANHLASLSDDETTKRVHWKRSARFLQEFSTGWEEVRRNSSVVKVEEAKAGAQIFCIQRCCHWTSELPALDQEMSPGPAPFQLQSFTATVRGCVDPNFALCSIVSNDDMLEGTFVRARNDLESSSSVGGPSNAPPEILERLRTLPYRMAEVLEKPDSAQDFFATLSAIDTLIECYTLSYAADDVVSVWMGMESWLRRLSDHFNRMMWHRSPPALIVLAHWLLLVERAEHYCWFLKGSATKVLRQIVGEFPEDSNVHSLVENLMD